MSLSILLICAVLMSLAFGVLLAYWLCMAMFQIFRMHTQQVQARRAVASPLHTIGNR